MTAERTPEGGVLTALFARLGRGYLSITALPGKLKAAERDALGIRMKQKFGVKEVVEKLPPLVPPFQLVEKGRSVFLIGSQPPDLVLEMIRRQPGKTIGELARNTPFTLERFSHIVNGLIREGRAIALIRPKSRLAELHPESGGQAPKQADAPAADERAAEPPAPSGEKDPVAAFKNAYEQAGRGKRFVEIYKIRRRLNWSREAFDALLEKLMLAGRVAANLGNPGDLTQDAVRDSYQDDYGDLYITVTWR